MSGMTTLQLVRNVCLAAAVGGTGSVVINTWKKDKRRAKTLLGYTTAAGLCGVSIGYAVAAAKRQNVYYHGLFVGGNYFMLTGTFLVFRDGILSTFGSGRQQLLVNQHEESNLRVLLASQPVPIMFASCAAGGTTGILFSMFSWRGALPAALHLVQGIGIAALGQFVYDRYSIWKLEKKIQYNYPELTGTRVDKIDESETVHWSKRLHAFLTGKSYSSQLNDDIRLSEIQLEILEEEERELKSKFEENLK